MAGEYDEKTVVLLGANVEFDEAVEFDGVGEDVEIDGVGELDGDGELDGIDELDGAGELDGIDELDGAGELDEIGEAEGIEADPVDDATSLDITKNR